MSRLIPNDRISRSRVPEPAGIEVERFHRQVPGYAATPLHLLETLGAELGLGRVSLKLENDRFGLPSFKGLGASWALEKALREQGSISLVVAASAGNHGRAVAQVAARRGLRCEIFLPFDCSEERATLIAGEGAQIVRVAGDYDAAVKVAEERAKEAETLLLTDMSQNSDDVVPAWITEGYSTMFREIEAQTTDRIDLVIVPIGVGSLAAAAVRWAVHRGDARVIGVEPLTAACVSESLRLGIPTTVITPGTSMAGMNCPTPSAVAWATIRDGLDGTITVSDSEVHDEMRRLLDLGFRTGDCGASTIAALRVATREAHGGEL